MSLRATITAEIGQITRDNHRSVPPITDGPVLLDTPLDALRGALPVARMDDHRGVDPSGAVEAEDLPAAVGDLVAPFDRAARAATA